MDYLHQICKPKLQNKELIAIDLTSEYMSIDSECQLFLRRDTLTANNRKLTVATGGNLAGTRH